MAEANETSSAVFILVEGDFQAVAEERIGRQLTSDEMRSVVKAFENGINWYEVAECAIDNATE